MVDISSISVVIAATSVVIGVIFAVLELRNVVQQRQTDLIMRLYSTFGSKEFQEAYQTMRTTDFKDYNDAMRKGYLPSWYTVATLFEGIGVLLHRKLVDIELVDHLFRESIRLVWEKAKPIMYDVRKQLNLPTYGRWFEYLYNEMQKREQQTAKI